MVSCVVVVVLSLAACIHGDGLRPDVNNSVTFVVSISVPDHPRPSTRAISDFGPEDNRVNEVSVLLFNPATGAYISCVHTTDVDTDTDPGRVNIKRFRVEVPIGTYKALFIANGSALLSQICNLNAGTYVIGGALITMSDIEDELLYGIPAGSKYNAKPGTGGYRPFYMCSPWTDLTIPIPLSVDYEAHPITLSRDVAKINLQFANPTIASQLSLGEILVCNYNKNGYIVPASGWWTHPAPLFATSGVTRPVALETGLSNAISYLGADFNSSGECVDEIFVYESPAGSLCLLVRASSVTINGQTQAHRWYKLDFRFEDAGDNKVKPVNILRNNSYTLKISQVNNFGHGSAAEAYANEPEGLVLELESRDKLGLREYVYGDQYYLAVDHSRIYLYHQGGTESMQVYTTYGSGWQMGVVSYHSGGSGWLSPAPSPGQTNAANTASATPVSIHATPYTVGSLPRTASFNITAGALTKTIHVTQFPQAGSAVDNFPSNVHTYVGAFWRSNQWGERLIRILRPTSGTPAAIDGNWVATVLEGRDWLVLDAAMTTDNAIWTAAPQRSGNDPGFDMLHQVNSLLTIVEGNMGTGAGQKSEIYFRIGARSTYTPTPLAPVRYGVVLLWCRDRNLTHRIWIRQGEEADYLMRPDDPGANVPSGRPAAARFSPYNLTAEVLNAAVLTQADAATGMTGNRSRFTDYPSQAGALFQWNGNATYIRYAWDSFTSANPIAPTSWPSAVNGQTWDAGKVANETCPFGYRRHNDGITSGWTSNDIAGSETRQSLWLNPQSGGGGNIDNSVWGYYADGWFDRRAIGQHISVAAGTRNMAYIGRLFFNPLPASGSYKASLFFPAAGMRATGALGLAGTDGSYWSSSCLSANNAQYLHVQSAAALVVGVSKGYAMSIRCVRD